MILQFYCWVCIRRKLEFEKIPCTPVFIAALFTIAKTWKKPKCPLIDKWINMKYYSIKNEIMPFAATWMDLKMIILSEVSQIKTNI